MTDAFEGRWVKRNGVMVSVTDAPPPKVTCKVCGAPGPAALCRPCRDSDRKRVHGSHAGFNQHQRNHEEPCTACAQSEREYQGKRYRRGQLSERDRSWAEKNAVKSSWELDTRTNRRVSVTNT